MLTNGNARAFTIGASVLTVDLHRRQLPYQKTRPNTRFFTPQKSVPYWKANDSKLSDGFRVARPLPVGSAGLQQRT